MYEAQDKKESATCSALDVTAASRPLALFCLQKKKKGKDRLFCLIVHGKFFYRFINTQRG